MNVPDNLKYTESHEWVRADGDTATVGITDFAQEQLTELVYVELPDIGRKVSEGDDVAVVESVKSASDIYAPIGGEITEVNEKLTDDPSLVNSSPFEDGWLFRIKMDDSLQLNGLMTPEAYKEQIGG